jgi:hypothetical protein
MAADVRRMPSAAFDDEVCGAAVPGVTVRLHDTDVSGRTLDALSDRFGDDMHRWDGTFDLLEAAADERGFVFIGVDDPASPSRSSRRPTARTTPGTPGSNTPIRPNCSTAACSAGAEASPVAAAAPGPPPPPGPRRPRLCPASARLPPGSRCAKR